MIRGSLVDEFCATGLVVLRGFFDPDALSEEVDRTLADGVRAGSTVSIGTGGNAFCYVPMMCETTPVSLSLVDALAESAAVLLERNVIPTRAKATRYFGATAWHSDSDLPIASVGFAAYLEPLSGRKGALRVVPGSHLAAAVPPTRAARAPTLGQPIATTPGDIIAFDEHLWHASTGGRNRRQWRVDFVVDPTDPREDALVRTYFARIFPRGWDGGYDADRYPSYGPHWQSSGRPWVDRLREIGAYGLAEQQEQTPVMPSRSRGLPACNGGAPREPSG